MQERHRGDYAPVVLVEELDDLISLTAEHRVAVVWAPRGTILEELLTATMRRPETTAAASPTAVPAAERGRSRLALGDWWRFATIGNGGLRYCGAGREDWVLRAGS